MRKGAASVAAVQEEQAARAARKAELGKAWWFKLPKPGDEKRVLFLEGLVDPEHHTIVPGRFYDHFLEWRGEWQHFVCPKLTCPEKKDSCPICESGMKGSQADLMSVLTIIVLTPYTSGKGEVFPFTRMLYVCRSGTWEKLLALAMKRGGLKGWVVDIKRSHSKGDNYNGDIFDFQKQVDVDSEAIKARFMRTVKDEKGNESQFTVCEPLDWEEEIVFRTGDELRAMGFGATGPKVAGGVTPPQGDGASQVNHDDIPF